MSKPNGSSGELVADPTAKIEAHRRHALDAPADEKNDYVRHAVQLLPLVEQSRPKLNE